MQTSQGLHKTPLYQEHLALSARMVPFAGWEMPVQYEGILKEYEATRRGAAIFDICHMGEFIINGHYRRSGLDAIVTMSLADLPVKACRYGAILNEAGGVIDDLIVFRMEEEKWFLVVNAGTASKDADHFRGHLAEKGSFEDVSAKTGKIDIQGPLAREVLGGLVEGIRKLEYYAFDFFDFLGEKVLISRTGYTGELGYELYCPWEMTAVYWRAFMRDGRVRPAGLGARDVLRLEVGYNLYGHELREDRSALQSGLARFICWEKDFIGKDSLAAQKAKGLPKKLTGIVSSSRKAPREGDQVVDEDGNVLGEVTSGSFSPALERGIGLAVIAAAVQPKTKIFFGSRGMKSMGTIEARAFYKNGSLKN